MNSPSTWNYDAPVNSESFRKAMKLMAQKQWDQAAEILSAEFEQATLHNDSVRKALILSAMALQARARNQPKEAWKYYAKAERCLPADASLKILVAQFLLDIFGQADSCLSKIEPLLVRDDLEPGLRHGIHHLAGRALIKLGQWTAVSRHLELLISDPWNWVQRPEDIQLSLIGELLKKNKLKPAAIQYLNKVAEWAGRNKALKLLGHMETLLNVLKSEA
jgi:tetratricopeptide (TPR) repeat protein